MTSTFFLRSRSVEEVIIDVDEGVHPNSSSTLVGPDFLRKKLRVMTTKTPHFVFSLRLAQSLGVMGRITLQSMSPDEEKRFVHVRRGPCSTSAYHMCRHGLQ